MTEIEIRSPRYDESVGGVAWDVRARVRVEDGELTFDGEPGFRELRSMPILDPATGRQIVAIDDPERWAQLLPTALRSGDLVAVVVCGEGRTDADAAAASAGEPEPHIPQPPARVRSAGRSRVS